MGDDARPATMAGRACSRGRALGGKDHPRWVTCRGAPHRDGDGIRDRSSSTGADMTADLEQASDLDQMGPVDYVVLAFPTDRMTGEALPLLVDLVDRGVIRILDL